MINIESYNFLEFITLIILAIAFVFSIVISVLQFKQKYIPYGPWEKIWRSLLIWFLTGVMGFSILLFFDILDNDGYWEQEIYFVSFVCAILPVQCFAAINAFVRISFLNRLPRYNLHDNNYES